MSKIVFDSNGIRTKSLQNLSLATSNLENAKEIAASLDIPDFSYSTYLASIPSLLSDNITNCNEDIAWLEKSLDNYSRFSDENCSDISKFFASEIVKKEIFINQSK